MIEPQDFVEVDTDAGRAVLRIEKTHGQRAYFTVVENEGLDVYEEIPFIYVTDNEGSESINILNRDA